MEGSGPALAAGGGVDVHLSERLALRVAADYRRLAIPPLEGAERVFMRDDADRHLGRCASRWGSSSASERFAGSGLRGRLRADSAIIDIGADDHS